MFNIHFVCACKCVIYIYIYKIWNSYFILCINWINILSRIKKEKLTDPEGFVGGQQRNGGVQEFKLKRSESLTSVNSSYFFNKSNNSDKSSMNNGGDNHLKKVPDLEQFYLRLCCNCSDRLEKKYKTLKDKNIKSKFSAYYEVYIDLRLFYGFD